jgi:hypothetical protein
MPHTRMYATRTTWAHTIKIRECMRHMMLHTQAHGCGALPSWAELPDKAVQHTQLLAQTLPLLAANNKHHPAITHPAGRQSPQG